MFVLTSATPQTYVFPHTRKLHFYTVNDSKHTPPPVCG